MSYRDGQNELKRLILAGYPLIYVVTDDERPVIETLQIIADQNSKKHQLYSWNRSTGIYNENGNTHHSGKTSYHDVMNFAKSQTHNSIYVLQDFHACFDEKEMVLRLKDTVLNITVPMTENLALKRYQTGNGYHYKTLVITSPVLKVPEELNKLMSVVQFGLPGKKEVNAILDTIGEKSKDVRRLTREEREKIVNASIGLTETEIVNAFTKSMIMNDGDIVAKDVAREKKQIIQKDGLLEFHEPQTGMEDVGGLQHLMAWVKKRKLAYDEDVRKRYNLVLPKGLLMTGIQGCGKSHSVKAIANYLEMPLIRLDIGALMGMWVGESEGNVRRAIKLAESISPCVLWIDEIDKGVPSPQASNTHETTKRVTSTLLTWLQEKEHPVFVVATANNIDHLPPELMRKGRFDEIFFIDLPTEPERMEILRIHLTKKSLNPNDFQLEEVLPYTDGFSGAEIEVLINEANFQAAYAGETLATHHLIEEAKQTNPLSKTMGDKINAIREWATKNNVRKAS